MPANLEQYVEGLRNRRRLRSSTLVLGFVTVFCACSSVAYFLLYRRLLISIAGDSDIDVSNLISLNAASICATLSLALALIGTFALCALIAKFDRSKERLIVEMWDRIRALEEKDAN